MGDKERPLAPISPQSEAEVTLRHVAHLFKSAMSVPRAVPGGGVTATLANSARVHGISVAPAPPVASEPRGRGKVATIVSSNASDRRYALGGSLASKVPCCNSVTIMQLVAY